MTIGVLLNGERLQTKTEKKQDTVTDSTDNGERWIAVLYRGGEGGGS